MRSWRERNELTTQPRRCRSHTIMARILADVANRAHGQLIDIDESQPGGKPTFHIFATLADSECTPIIERTRAGMEAARARDVGSEQNGSFTGSDSEYTLKLIEQARILPVGCGPPERAPLPGLPVLAGLQALSRDQGICPKKRLPCGVAGSVAASIFSAFINDRGPK
jgi:hypothetical protein